MIKTQTIATQYIAIRKTIADCYEQIAILREECEHTFATKHHQFDDGEDGYPGRHWIDNKCDDCGNYWSTHTSPVESDF